jgi:serine/threonine protein kinase
MAPEMAAGHSERIDTRTEVYMLGATLFDLLTDQPPHAQGGKAAYEIIREIVYAKATPRARTVHASVPPALDAVCAKAMARAPEDRYPDVNGLARDVEAWLNGQEVSAYPSSRIRRWFRSLWGSQRRG